MRYLKMDDVKHLNDEKYGSKIELLAQIVVVARRINEEKSNSTNNKKTKKLPSSPKSLPSSGRQISGKVELKEPSKENQSFYSWGVKLKFKFEISMLIDRALPISSGSRSFKNQETPTCSGTNSLKKIEEVPTISGIKRLKRQGEASSSCSPKKKHQVGGDKGPPPGLPQSVKDLIRVLAAGKVVSEPILVVKKGLFASDILTDQNRFMIPKKQMKPFLDGEEIASLPLEQVMIIEPNLNIGTVTLAKWKMSSDVYVLRGNWSKIVTRNSLNVGMVMQLLAVRIDDKLLLVLICLPPAISEGCNNGDQTTDKNADMED